MAKQVLTIEQATKAREWVAKFATGTAQDRANKIERQAGLEREERDEALKLLVEAGLDVTKALQTLRYVMDAVPEKEPSWSDKIRAAQVMLDFAKYLIPPEPPPPMVETTKKATLTFDNLSDDEVKFFATFSRLPTPAELAKLQGARDQKALPSSRTSEGTETTPTSG